MSAPVMPELMKEVDMRSMSGVIAQPGPRQAWLRRLGLGGFMFFLAKGLLWLTVPAMLAVAGLE
jgi:hypothetical protein